MYYTIFLFFLKKTVLFGNSIIDKVTNCTCHQENTTTLHNWWSTFSKRSSLCGRVSQCTLLRVSCNDFRCTHMCNRVFVCSCVCLFVYVCVLCADVLPEQLERLDPFRTAFNAKTSYDFGAYLDSLNIPVNDYLGAIEVRCVARVLLVYTLC